ncbi:esterase family protein [Aerococcaceae bacterium zg-ZJ1578]|uniref:esterase family protein n=1 Tax=Aerococcaceae TaxID=186827 RepID=UPI0013B65787|nr:MULTISPECIES: alpha/beta hydrolase-fold protein [unclassified Facklamia]MBK0348782.1 esterase family protein [Aerococcaceae bacterium zg-1578]MBS4461114.1 esterase family protein [Aerococcaceae bacterium zg-B36]QQD64858.1 esterase family protein [Aerococcaceae bacterium zg-252]NEW64397.1 esterase [Facklamia sp. 252]NEW68478.1 esterase [Facklamia sp. 253]
MQVEFLSHYSGHLGREMSLNRYGHSGMPIVVFPSSGGSHFEYADFGMIEACRYWIEAGRVQFFTLSSADAETWEAKGKSAHDMARRHVDYERYVIEEAIPFIKHRTGWFDPMMTTGCSMGAYHALNFYLQHPDVFQKVVALSGVYNASFFTGDYGNDPLVYQNSPSDYIWNQHDEWFINHYRNGDIIVCTGLGAWEQDGLPSFYSLKQAFEQKNIPAWFDEWGHDVAHDWVWWREQMPYYMGHLFG